MSEAKYYVPEITEIHIGFEYEQYERQKWNKLIQPPDDLPYKWYKLQFDTSKSLSKITKLISDNRIRVKFLDAEDIESFGFKYAPVYFKSNHPLYKRGEGGFNRFDDGKGHYLQHYTFEDRIVIAHPLSIIYNGKCKNKSKLKQILIDTGVVEEEYYLEYFKVNNQEQYDNTRKNR